MVLLGRLILKLTSVALKGEEELEYVVKEGVMEKFLVKNLRFFHTCLLLLFYGKG
jgi:hypothetical protein